MGGALSLYAGYHVNHDLAGVFACSSFLNDESIVFETLRKRKHQSKAKHLPKLLMYHGDSDNMVPILWAQETFDELVTLGVNGEFKTLENTPHKLRAGQLHEIEDWIQRLLPPLESDIVNKLWTVVHKLPYKCKHRNISQK